MTRDFTNARKQLEHVISDLETSIMAELDQIYKGFIERYGEFKSHMVALREIKRTLLNELPPEEGHMGKLSQSRNPVLSNRDLLSEIEKDTQLFRTQKIYSQITDMQKENIGPANNLASELIALGGLDAVYYDERSCSQMLSGLVETVHKEAKEAHPAIKGTFVLTPLQFAPQQNNVLHGLSEYENQEDDYDENIRGFKSADHREIIKNFQSPKKTSPKNIEIIP